MKNKKNSKNATKKALKFTMIGIILALFNFGVCTFLARVVFGTNELLWLDSLIAYCLATILAYFMHSKITWKDHRPTKTGIVRFFVWNLITALLISPLFTWLFGFNTPFYEFIFQISGSMGLPFDYKFIESTTIFCLTTAITMILNFIFYDRLVFGTKKSKNDSPEQSLHKS